MNSIPVGYQLHITSCENDGDHYGTKILDGLTAEEVKFYLCVVNQFECRNSSEQGFGNGHVKTEILDELIKNAFLKYPEVAKKVFPLYSSDDASELMSYELICELLGAPEDEYSSYDEDLGNFCREFDSYKVFKFEAPVMQVSAEFKE
jgi:hypothetical protein